MVRTKFNLIFESDVIKNPSQFNISKDINVLKNLSFGNLNVNTLNVSTHNKDSISIDDFAKKVAAFIKQKNDFIFLQDLRLNGRTDLLEKHIRCTPHGNFQLFCNSPTSKRGVCIIVNKQINFEPLTIYKSKCHNVILIDCLINNYRLTIGSIYGPVYYDCVDFFKILKDKVVSIGNKAFLIGGDMNCLTTITPANLTPDRGNIDTLNIATIPNPKNSEILNSWINDGFLVDLFRLLNPNLIDFSCAPFKKDYRSRIDHLLCPLFIADIFKSCTFYDITSTLFDHKMVIGKTKNHACNFTKCIDNSLLDIPGLYAFVKEDIYIFLAQNFEFPDERRIRIALKDINTVTKEYTQVVNSNMLDDPIVKFFITNCEEKLEKIYNKFPCYENCLKLPTDLDFRTFMLSFANTIKNSVISYQSDYIFNKNCYKRSLQDEIESLKNLYDWTPDNFIRLKDLESKLAEIEDREILREVIKFKHFDTLHSEKPSKYYCKLLKNASKCSINLINDDEGNSFTNEQEREDFLVKKFDEKFNSGFKPSLDIRTFLGEFFKTMILSKKAS